MIARALWHITPQESDIKENDIGEISRNQLLIKSMFSLISCGTERLVSKGQVPPRIWSEMTIPYMEGTFEFPIKYGYSLVGKVMEGSEKWTGKVVHLMHPHQDFAICYPVDVFEIPDNVPPRRAVLASNMEAAINAVWDSKISAGDVVLIAGFGIIGALTGIIMKNIPGVKVFVYDEDHFRMMLAKDLGFFLFPQDCKENMNFDITVNASASNKGLQMCIDLAGFESRILEMSWFGDQSVVLDLGGDFHKYRKQIISSQVSAIPFEKQSRWTLMRRKQIVFEILAHKWFDSLLSSDIPFQESPYIFGKIRQKASQPGIVINYL